MGKRHEDLQLQQGFLLQFDIKDLHQLSKT